MRAIVALGVLMLSSCSSLPYPADHEPVTSLPAGSVIMLKHTIVIASGRRSVYLYQGRVVDFAQLDIRHPYCQLVLDANARTAQTIHPDAFRIVQVSDWDGYMDQESGRADHASGHESHVSQAVMIDIKSLRQPQVRQLNCQRWSAEGEVVPLVLADVRTALGAFFELLPE